MGGGKHPQNLKGGTRSQGTKVQLLGTFAQEAIAGKGATTKPKGKATVTAAGAAAAVAAGGAAKPVVPVSASSIKPEDQLREEAEEEAKAVAEAEAAAVAAATAAEEDVAEVDKEKMAAPALPPDADPALSATPQRMRYDCRKCRKPLFTTDAIVGHSDSEEAKGHKAFSGQKKYHQSKIMAACSSVFLDPEQVDWVEEQAGVGGNSGDLVCPFPKCGVRIGAWSWIGSQCSCGQWVNPSFKIIASKLDALSLDAPSADTPAVAPMAMPGAPIVRPAVVAPAAAAAPAGEL